MPCIRGQRFREWWRPSFYLSSLFFLPDFYLIILFPSHFKIIDRGITLYSNSDQVYKLTRERLRLFSKIIRAMILLLLTLMAMILPLLTLMAVISPSLTLMAMILPSLTLMAVISPSLTLMAMILPSLTLMAMILPLLTLMAVVWYNLR